jgi:hypothetical protein
MLGTPGITNWGACEANQNLSNSKAVKLVAARRGSAHKEGKLLQLTTQN